MGGNKKTESAQVPIPTIGDEINQYIAALPRLIEIQGQLAPNIQEQTLRSLRGFAPQLIRAQLDAVRQSDPELSSIRDSLLSDVRTGLAEGLPDSVRDEFLDRFRAELGTNLGSPVGAFDTSRQLLNLNEQFKNNFRSIAQNLIQGIPNAANLTNLAVGSTPQIAQNFTPGQALNFGQNRVNQLLQQANIQDQLGLARRGQNLKLIGGLIGAGTSFIPAGG